MHTFALYVAAQWHNASNPVAFIAVLTAAVSLGVIAAGLSEFGLSCRKTAMVVFVGSGFLAVCVVRPVAAPYLVGAFLATMIVLPLIMLLIGAAGGRAAEPDGLGRGRAALRGLVQGEGGAGRRDRDGRREQLRESDAAGIRGGRVAVRPGDPWRIGAGAGEADVR